MGSGDCLGRSVGVVGLHEGTRSDGVRDREGADKPISTEKGVESQSNQQRPTDYDDDAKPALRYGVLPGAPHVRLSAPVGSRPAIKGHHGTSSFQMSDDRSTRLSALPICPQPQY